MAASKDRGPRERKPKEKPKGRPEGKGRRANGENGARASERRAGRSRPDDAGGVPGWLPPVLYAVLALVLFREFVFSNRMLMGSDTLLGGGYVARALYADAMSELGRIPRWAPHILGGTPFLEALSGGDSLYPPSLLLLLVLEPYRALGWKLVLHVFLAGLFFFGWVRAIGGSRQAALLGGVAYMMAPFFIGFVTPGHDGKIFVIALAPLLFWATERHFRYATLASASGVGLVVALVMLTTHFQMAYFLFGATGLYAIFRTVQIVRGVDEVVGASAGENGGRAREGESRGEREAGGEEKGESDGSPADSGAPSSRGAASRAGPLRFALFLAASVLGATGAAYQFAPAVDYVTEYSRRTQTTREAAGESGRAWSSSWSMHPEEAMSLLIPEFPGNNANGADWSSETYWGRNAFKDNHEYAGLVVLLLAAVAFAGGRRRQLRVFLVGLGLFALAFALGTHTPVWGLLYAFLPGIPLFRAPGMAVYLFGFAAITLGALGLDRLREVVTDGDDEERARVRRVLWVGAGATALLAMLATSGALTSIWTSVVYPSIDERGLQRLAAHGPNIVHGASIAFLLAAATAGLSWAADRGRLPWRLAFAGLVALVALDAGRLDGSFIQTLDFFEWSQPDPNVRAVLEREQGRDEPYRLLSFARRGQDVLPAMHGIELAGGHHPNDLARYRELIGMVGSGLPGNLVPCNSLAQCTALDTEFNPNVRRLLNVRYIVWPDAELGAWPGGSVLSRTQLSGGRPYQTLLAEDGLDRARLVGRAVVRSDAEAVEYILSEAHDPATEAVLAEDPGIELDGTPPVGSARWVERGFDRHVLEVESDRAALLVVADNWFPAWRATVNGTESEVLRAYHTLRAVPVPAGTSRVEMWYASELVRWSRLVSLVTLALLLGVWIWGTLRPQEVV